MRASGCIGLAALAIPSAGWAQSLGQGVDAGIPWLHLFGALALCLALAVAAAWAIRFKAQGGASFGKLDLGSLLRWVEPRAAAPRRLQAIESTRLPNQATASVLRCDGQDYLVIVSMQGHIAIRPLSATDADTSA